MAVLFPTPFGYTLRPNKTAELLQGFINIQRVEDVTTGELSKADLVSYGQKRFFAADPSSAVAGYLNQNFAAIAKIDGNANTISVDDLVAIRGNLPTPPTVENPPVPPTQPPTTNVNTIQYFFFILIQQMMSMFGFH